MSRNFMVKLTWSSADDSSEGKESIKTSISFAFLAISEANNFLWSEIL